MGVKARLIAEVGTVAWLRIYWGKRCKERSYHNAKVPLGTSAIIGDQELGGSIADHPESAWPTDCDHCGETAPADAKRQVFRRRRYNTASGIPEVGDLYFIDWLGRAGGGCIFHDNCDGVHLYAMLPNGNEWDIDGRASNCTDKDDRLHRCWIRHGEPPNLTVDKKGLTCRAGAGSIASGSYHGFLRGGAFT